ncbi:hypothetical protein [Carp edema virus]|nr:hypothetical protein [Carp edema virus]
MAQEKYPVIKNYSDLIFIPGAWCITKTTEIIKVSNKSDKSNDKTIDKTIDKQIDVSVDVSDDAYTEKLNTETKDTYFLIYSIFNNLNKIELDITNFKLTDFENYIETLFLPFDYYFIRPRIYVTMISEKLQKLNFDTFFIEVKTLGDLFLNIQNLYRQNPDNENDIKDYIGMLFLDKKTECYIDSFKFTKTIINSIFGKYPESEK